MELFTDSKPELISLGLGMLIEYWLGKTDKVKAGSTLELVLNGAKTVLSLVKLKKKK